MSEDKPEAGPVVFSLDRRYRYTLTRVRSIQCDCGHPRGDHERVTQYQEWCTRCSCTDCSASLPRLLMWIGLNPSTADEERLDPTLRRIWGFSRAWGYDGFVMTNLFAFRATKPLEMKAQIDPIGPDNDHWLQACGSKSDQILCCWGAHGVYRDRSQAVVDLLTDAGFFPKLRCLKLVANGEPGHPLYLPLGATPMLYPPR